MKKKNFKGGRVVKKKSAKSADILKLYDKIQIAFLAQLEADAEVERIDCNVPIDEEYTSDFMITKTDGEVVVRECVFRNQLSLPRMCKLLDASREYWLKRGVVDWGIITNMEGAENEDSQE